MTMRRSWSRVVVAAVGLLTVVLGGCTVRVGEQTVEEAEPAPVTARSQPGTGMGLYEPEQHELYDGRFVITGTDVHQVGSLDDESPWDHMGDDASNVAPVGGEITIDVDEIANTGTFRAELQLPEGDYVVELDRFHEFSECQDGGIAAYLFEHGDAGCGDSNWPKSLLYIAGWGYGRATLNGEELYSEYQIHFMVTQGMRDRETLQVQLEPNDGPAGLEVVGLAGRPLAVGGCGQEGRCLRQSGVA